MDMILENIGKIRSAEVKLDGLTVIAGNNGSGKSTVGKMLFSVIQVLKSTQDDIVQQQHNLLKRYVETLYLRLNSLKIPAVHLYDKLPRNYQLANQLFDETITVEQLQDAVNAILDETKSVSPRTRANINSDIRNIKLCIENANNRAATQASSIQSIIESEFLNSVCSIGTTKSRVLFNIDDNSSLEFRLKNDRVTYVENHGNEMLRDATYVESPLYLHMLESLSKSIQYVETDSRRHFRGMIPTHIKDFIEKMVNAKSTVINDDNYYNDILLYIHELVSGGFQFNKNNNKLEFVSEGVTYFPINVASGIKTLGVMQLLLQGNLVDPNRLLIWDEPENHLHPQWQVNFADIILRMVAKGIPIVISTHSPYFIQAIRYNAAKYKLEENVNYYLSEECYDGLAELKDVTKDLNKIFAKLSGPLADVLNVDRVRHNE